MAPAVIPGSYLDAIGVDIHTDYNWYPIPLVQQCLDHLGVVRVRDSGRGGTTKLGGRVLTLAICGVDFHVGQNADADELENINEIDGDPRWKGKPDWIAQAQAAMAAVTKANNGAKRLIGSSLGLQGQNPGTGATVGVIPNQDAVSIHTYRAMRTPAQWLAAIQTYRNNGLAMVPHRPVLVTEMGYTDAPAGIGGEVGQTRTPDTVAAQTIVSDISDCLDVAERCYVYQLLDHSKPTNYSHYMGLFRADGSPKPQADALRAFLLSFGSMRRRDVITLYNQQPPVTPTPSLSVPWAVPITPDPTPRIKAMQTAVGADADGIIGNETLTRVEGAIKTRDTAQAQVSVQQTKMASAVVALRNAEAALSS